MIARSWVRSPDFVCLEQDTFHIVPVHSDEYEYQQKLGVNLAIDRRPIQGGVLHSQLLNATKIGISSGLMYFNFNTIMPLQYTTSYY